MLDAPPKGEQPQPNEDRTEHSKDDAQHVPCPRERPLGSSDNGGRRGGAEDGGLDEVTPGRTVRRWQPLVHERASRRNTDDSGPDAFGPKANAAKEQREKRNRDHERHIRR